MNVHHHVCAISGPALCTFVNDSNSAFLGVLRQVSLQNHEAYGEFIDSFGNERAFVCSLRGLVVHQLNDDTTKEHSHNGRSAEHKAEMPSPAGLNQAAASDYASQWWKQASPIPGVDRTLFRLDVEGNVIYRYAFGQIRSPYAWMVDSVDGIIVNQNASVHIKTIAARWKDFRERPAILEEPNGTHQPLDSPFNHHAPAVTQQPPQQPPLQPRDMPNQLLPIAPVSPAPRASENETSPAPSTPALASTSPEPMSNRVTDAPPSPADGDTMTSPPSTPSSASSRRDSTASVSSTASSRSTGSGIFDGRGTLFKKGAFRLLADGSPDPTCDAVKDGRVVLDAEGKVDFLRSPACKKALRLKPSMSRASVSLHTEPISEAPPAQPSQGAAGGKPKGKSKKAAGNGSKKGSKKPEPT